MGTRPGPPGTRAAASRCRQAIAALALLLPIAAWAEADDDFRLTSPDFEPDGQLDPRFVFKGMGCSGGNLSPALHWAHPPAGTQSYALMVHDPDAQTGGAGIWHWVVYNIPGSADGLAQGAGDLAGHGLPPGSVQVRTDFEATGWNGPCPPPGAPAHRYVFTLYALPVDRLDMPADATASHAGFLINRIALGRARLGARFAR